MPIVSLTAPCCRSPTALQADVSKKEVQVKNHAKNLQKLKKDLEKSGGAWGSRLGEEPGGVTAWRRRGALCHVVACSNPAWTEVT